VLSDLIKSESELDRRHKLPFTARTIFVDRRPSSDVLIERRGHPVWPIRGPDDWGAVSRLCQFRSIHIQEVQGQPGELKRRRGIVTGIGCEKIQEVARLYAHLTSRRFNEDGDASFASGLSRSSVIVTTFRHLKADLLHALYSDARALSCPGLICASGVEELRRQVLVRSILARPGLIEEAAPWTAIFPTVKTGTPPGHRLQILDSRSLPERVRAALIARSGLLAIATHSDGVDAFLGPSLTLCAIDAGGPSEDRPPSCWLSGYCHRHGVSVEEFRRLGVSIDPADISAGILILDTCFGTLTSQGPINSHWGLGRRFIENLAIGAIVTTWELTLLDVRKLEKLVSDLGSGMTLGRAIARFNRSGIARRTAARLAVFGDPETRAAMRPRIASPARRIVRTLSLPASTKSAELRELGFSRAYLEHGIASLTANVANCPDYLVDRIKRQLEVAKDALDRLKRYELAQWRAEPSTPADAARAEELRRALIVDAYVRRPTDDWKQFAGTTVWKDFSCRACGAPGKAGVLALRIPGVSRRRVVMCPRCGVTEDMPEHVDITLRLEGSGDICAITGALPDREWSGALIVRTRIESHDRMWTWPAGPDGRPSASMELPEGLPSGPSRLAVVIVCRGWLAWTAQGVHGGPRNRVSVSRPVMRPRPV
jgi:hypothetical protein